jgi:hypothetical protein
MVNILSPHLMSGGKLVQIILKSFPPVYQPDQMLCQTDFFHPQKHGVLLEMFPIKKTWLCQASGAGEALVALILSSLEFINSDSIKKDVLPNQLLR